MEHLMSKEEIRKKLKSNFDKGLKEEEAEARLQEFGKNILRDRKSVV